MHDDSNSDVPAGIPRPSIGPACRYEIYFPTGRVGDLLHDLARLFAPVWEELTDLVLPGGQTITVPFRFAAAQPPIPLIPPARMRFETYLFFPDGPPDARHEAHLRVHVRLWLYLDQHNAALYIFAPNPDRLQRFVESPAVHHHLFQLMVRHKGVMSLLRGIGQQVGYLLPDLRLRLPLPRYNYLDGAEGPVVDQLIGLLMQERAQPTPPPAYRPLPGETKIEPDEAIRRLERAYGSIRSPIPARYRRTLAAEGFETCGLCGRSLRDPGTFYTVTKFFADGDLRQELAMCHHCAKELEACYSVASRQALQRLMRLDSPARHRPYASLDEDARLDAMTRTCLLCDSEKADASYYVEYAMCEVDELVTQLYPYVICDECTVRLYDAMSNQTKDDFRGFYDRHFGFPPGGSPARELSYELFQLVVA